MESIARISCFLFIILLKLSIDSHSQEVLKKSPWSYGANAYYGSVFRYVHDQPKIMFTGLHGVEFYAQKSTYGSHDWEKLYNLPNIGVSLSYFNYGDPEVLGKVISTTCYIDLGLFQRKTNQLRFNIGTGMVYSTRRFDVDNNPLNSAISSKISYVLRGTLHYELKLSDHQFINFNAGFRHYSNGKLNMPNNGMNFPIVGVGYRYAPGSKPEPISIESSIAVDPKIHFNIMGSIAWREVLEIDTKHKVATISLYASKQVSKYNAILLGVDGFYYEDSNIESAIQDPQVPDDMVIDGRQAAVTLGNEFNLGKLWIMAQAGIYVFMPAKLYSNWYQRYGLKYYITKDLFINTSLKTHSRTANMVEFGLGLKL